MGSSARAIARTCWLVSTRAGPNPTSTSPTGVPSDARKFSGSCPPSREPVSAKWMACHALCRTTWSRRSASEPYRKRVMSEGCSSKCWISVSEAGRRLPIIFVAADWRHDYYWPRMRAVGLIVLGLAALVWLIPAAPLTGDGQHYIEFVRNNLQHGASSWHERRLLGPLIVRALPFDALDGFFLLTVVSLAMTALLTWLSARATIEGTWRALLAVPLVFDTWVVAPNIREYGLIDPLAWAFVAGVWLPTVRQRWWIAAGVAAVGVLAKEVVVLAALAAA